MGSGFWRNILTDFNTAKPVYAGIGNPAIPSSLPAETETVVIGGGLLGLSAALELAQAGHSAVVIEANKIGDGPSARSGGQLWPGTESLPNDMIKDFGPAQTARLYRLVDEALGKVHERAATRADKCDFHPGTLIAARNGNQAEWIRNATVFFQESGFRFAAYLSGEEIRKHYVNTGHYLNGILYKGEAGRQYGHLNPLKYTQTVAKLAQEMGAMLVENSPVKNVQAVADGGYLVTTPHGVVTTKNIVLATGVNFLRPSGVGYDLVPRTNVPVKSVILATEPLPEKKARALLPGDACFCDADEAAMNYGRLIPEPGRDGYYRLTFGGTSGLTQAQIAMGIPKVTKEMQALFPQIEQEKIKIGVIWGGRCDLSRKLRPILMNPLEGLFHASGFSGQGMVNTALYGSAIADRILQRDTGVFETLEKLSPSPYAKQAVLAWIQAARILLPLAYQSYRDEKAERSRRGARAKQSLSP